MQLCEYITLLSYYGSYASVMALLHLNMAMTLTYGNDINYHHQPLSSLNCLIIMTIYHRNTYYNELPSNNLLVILTSIWIYVSYLDFLYVIWLFFVKNMYILIVIYLIIICMFTSFILRNIILLHHNIGLGPFYHISWTLYTYLA